MNELVQEYDLARRTYYITIEKKKIYLNDIYDNILECKNNNKIEINGIIMGFHRDISNTKYIVTFNNSIKPIEIYSKKKIKLSVNEATVFNFINVKSFINYHKIKSSEIILNNIPNSRLSNFFLIESEEIIVTLKSNNYAEKNFDIKIKNPDSNLLCEYSTKNKNYIKYSNNSKYFDTPERQNFIKTIQKKLIYYKTVFVFGPSGIGKTVTLLNFRHINNDDIVFYLNLKYLYKIYDMNELFNDIIDELSYCFDDNIIFNNFIKNNLRSILKESKTSNNIYNFICKMIEEIISYLGKETPEEKGIYVIIDQYQSSFDKNKTIINILNNNNNIQSIICSSMNESNVREVILDTFLNDRESKTSYILQISNFGNIDLSILSDSKKNILVEMFEKMPRYYEEIKNIEDNKLKDFIYDKYSYISKKINDLLYFKIYNTKRSKIEIIRKILNNEGIELDLNNFREYFPFLHLKYFIVSKEKNEKFKYKYAFSFIKYVYEKLLEEALDEINSELFNDSQYSCERAWNFEYLVNSYFSIDNQPFQDLKYTIKKKIYIDSIYDLKEVDLHISLNDNNISINENNIISYKIDGSEKIKKLKEFIIEDGIIDICQRPYGEGYDGALLIPVKKNNYNKREYYMLLYQVTLDKNLENFLTRLKIINSIPNIKKKFESIFDIKIKKFYFTYILYYFRKGHVNVERLCDQYNNKLFYCYYNPDEKKLLNKKGLSLKWNLLKKNSKIIKLTEEIINYNKNLCFSNEVKEEINEKILNIKIKREKNILFEEDIKEEEKKEIQRNVKFNVISYQNYKIKTIEVNEQNNNNINTFKDSDYSSIFNDNNIQKNNTNKNKIKSELKKNYIEQNKLKHIIDLIPSPNNFEKNNIIKDEVYLHEYLKNKIKLFFNNDNNIIIEGRNFYTINEIIGHEIVFLLYYNYVNNGLILAYNDKNKKYLCLYDLTSDELILNEKYYSIITYFLSVDFLYNNNYISYLLHYEN